jgi:hypothetical protein
VIETSLLASDKAVAAVLAETRAYGQRDLETGGFLLATLGSESLTGVALAGGAGITRYRQLFQVSEGALDRLFTFVDDCGLWVPVQFHTHEATPFMSWTDQRHGLRVEGFVSTIIPDFVAPPDDIGSWGWWQFQQGDWHRCAPAKILPVELDFVIVFDEDGIREP